MPPVPGETFPEATSSSSRLFQERIHHSKAVGNFLAGCLESSSGPGFQTISRTVGSLWQTISRGYITHSRIPDNAVDYVTQYSTNFWWIVTQFSKYSFVDCHPIFHQFLWTDTKDFPILISCQLVFQQLLLNISPNFLLFLLLPNFLPIFVTHPNFYKISCNGYSLLWWKIN